MQNRGKCCTGTLKLFEVTLPTGVGFRAQGTSKEWKHSQPKPYDRDSHDLRTMTRTASNPTRLQTHTHTCARTHMRAHTRARARARTHTHTHTHTHKHSPSESFSVDRPQPLLPGWTEGRRRLRLCHAE